MYCRFKGCFCLGLGFHGFADFWGLRGGGFGVGTEKKVGGGR